MSHFAEIDGNGEVLRVVVVPDKQESRGQQFLAKDLKLGGVWIQTSYNNNIRNKFAGVGDFYLEDEDIFIEAKPYKSWVLAQDEDGKYSWAAPVAMPLEGDHNWDEESQTWLAVEA